jgi:plasmid stability protein
MRDLTTSRIMPRTTLDVDPGVLRELRLRAGREGKSMGQVASEVLAGALREDGPKPPPAFEWRSGDLGRPLVDLEDKEAIWAILDGRT